MSRVREGELTTKALIDAALNAKTIWEQAKINLQQATAALQEAEQALTEADQALHDDLVANGPCVVIDDTATPAVVTMYTAADPNTYNATVIRTAA